MTLYSLQWWFSFLCAVGVGSLLPLGFLAVFSGRGHELHPAGMRVTSGRGH